MDSFSENQFQNFSDETSIEACLFNALHFFVPLSTASIRIIGSHSTIIIEMKNQIFIITVGQNEKSVENLQGMFGNSQLTSPAIVMKMNLFSTLLN
jgi:hypothetical protein